MPRSSSGRAIAGIPIRAAGMRCQGMKRNLIQKLIEWKDTTERSPFLLTGRKGTGKTYLACDFAKSFYDNYIYINFETSPEMRRIFGGLNPGEG